jgi:hypothetical protein
MPRISRRRTDGSKSGHSPAARILALGEFLGSARWMMTPMTHTGAQSNFTNVRPATAEKESFAGAPEPHGEEGAASDAELGPLLGAIADDVHATAAAARDGVLADFAARVAYARRFLTGPQLAATLGAIAQARKAALAAVKRNAALELSGRKKAAIASRRRPHHPANGWLKAWRTELQRR